MANQELKFVTRGDSTDAQKAWRDAAKAVRELGDAEDDGRSKVAVFAAAAKAAADEAKAEFDETRATVAVLADALGTELVAKIDAAGGSLDGFVGKLRGEGASFDEIRDDADQLADAIRHVADVSDSMATEVSSSAARADEGLRKTAESGDQSRSVLANMVGNSTQDLGALGGVAGTAGMALGQLGEYAAEGNISLAGLAKVAGPMLALTVAVKGVSMVMEALGHHAADVKRQTELLVDVQQKLADNQAAQAAAELNKEWSGSVEVLKKYGLSAQDLVEHMAGQKDLIPQLSALVDEHTTVSVRGTKAYDDQAVELRRLIGNLGEARESWTAAADQYATNTENTNLFTASLQRLSSTTGDTATAQQELADRAEYVKSRIDEATTSTDELEAATQRGTDAYAKSVQALQDAIDKRDELTAKALAAIDADYAYMNQARATNEALADYSSKLADGTLKGGELTDATEAMRQKMVDTATAMADTGGAAQGSQGYIDAMVQSLYSQLAALDPASPLYQAVQGYIAALNSIPARVATTIEATIRTIQKPDGTYTSSRNAEEGRAAGGVTDAGVRYEVAEGGRPEVYQQGGRTYLIGGAGGRVMPITSRGGAVGDSVTMNVFGHVIGDAGLDGLIERKLVRVVRRAKATRR